MTSQAIPASRIIPLAAALIFCFLLLALSPNAYTKEPSPRDTQQALSKIKKRIDAVKVSMQEQYSKQSKAQKALQATEVSIGKISKKLNDLDKKLITSEKKITSLKAENRELQIAKTGQQKALANDIRTSYMHGRQEYVKLLLNQEHPEKLARVIRYYDYFHRSRAQRIAGFKTTLQQIDDIAAKMELEAQQLERLNAVLTKQQSTLNQTQLSRKKVLKKVNANLKSKDAQLNQLKGNQSQLQELLAKVQRALDDLPSNIDQGAFSSRKGKLTWPTKGRISNRFGRSRAQGKLKWQGIVIRARAGNTVKAVHHGRVVFSDWLRGFGLITILDHGDGYMSIYGHNESLLKEPGQWVEAGEAIATVGNSGGRDEYGLYFEIRRNGKPTNPSRWMARK